MGGKTSDGQTAEGYNPESKRVQVPFGTPVLSFVCFAPNDGFGPESASPPGPVQREVLYAAAGGHKMAPSGAHLPSGSDTT